MLHAPKQIINLLLKKDDHSKINSECMLLKQIIIGDGIKAMRSYEPPIFNFHIKKTALKKN